MVRRGFDLPAIGRGDGHFGGIAASSVCHTLGNLKCDAKIGKWEKNRKKKERKYSSKPNDTVNYSNRLNAEK